jgi:hypothetical protein
MTEQPEPTVEPEVEPQAEQQPEGRDQRRDAHTRERLREVESERDQLRERLDARDRRHVQWVAQEVLGERGLALFTDYDLDALRGDDGDVDEALVQQAVEPRLALEEGRAVHHGDLGPRKTRPASSASTWAKVIGK